MDVPLLIEVCMYKITVYDKNGNVFEYVYFSMKEAKTKQSYIDRLSKNNITFQEEFFIQL